MMKPLEPSLPGETRSEYLARVDRVENEAWASWFTDAPPSHGVEEAFRAGFRAGQKMLENVQHNSLVTGEVAETDVDMTPNPKARFDNLRGRFGRG